MKKRDETDDIHIREDACSQYDDVRSMVFQDRNNLIERFRNGDTDAFKVIYMQWYDPIFYLLRRLTRSECDAEDLAQDVFGTLWIQRLSVDPSKDVKAYIFTLARRAASKHIRSTRVRSDYISGMQFDETEEGRDQSIALEMELLTDYVMSKMPPKRREAYLLSMKEGLDPMEIAERLNIPAKSARNYIYQARKEIREMLALAVAFWVTLN